MSSSFAFSDLSNKLIETNIVRTREEDCKLRQQREETRRVKQGNVIFEAIDKVMIECYYRGLKDPEGARRRMENKAKAAEAADNRQGEGGMRWQVN